MKIKFKDGEENFIIIEGADKKEGSLFRNQYERAEQIFAGLNGEENKDKRQYNNILAFCGDRGTGKTSCMQSFAEQKKSDDSLCFLKMIEPSFFDKSHNILELVISQMYKELCVETGDPELLEQQSEITEQFNVVMRYLKYLSKPEEKEKYYDPLQELDALSAGINLKDEINALIEMFLRFETIHSGKSKSILVITIDDLDLNIYGAYTMSEHIRKYLTNEHCILLLSVKVDQLVEAIRINLCKDTNVADAESYSMAVKYVTKLLPVGNRVNMPDTEDYCKLELDYEYNNEVQPYHSVQESVTYNIFWKTGYLFYNSKGRSSLVIPRNLRSLRQLLHLLIVMPIHRKEDKDNHLRNQKLFKQYFYQTWTQQLNSEYRTKILMILDNGSETAFCKTIVSQLSTLKQFEHADTYSDILSRGNYAYNVSIGDVMRLLEYLSQDESDYQLQLFVFFIRSLCSIRLYEAYDHVTENIATELFPARQEDVAGEIYSSDSLFAETNMLQQIVNGQYFSFEPGELLAPDKEGSKDRDILAINGEVLSNELKTIAEHKNNINEEDQKKFKLLEFFMLCVSRRAILKRQSDRIKKDRQSSDPLHLTVFSKRTKNLVFDVTAPFYNMLNIKSAYNRFNDAFRLNAQDESTIYDFANANDWSLLRTMLHNINREYGEEENDILHALMSDVVIRNAEVLAAITEMIKSKRHVSRSGSVNKEHIKNFYSSITKTQMSTYPRALDEQPYIIEFNFLKSIEEVLQSCDSNFFDSIYGVIEDGDLMDMVAPLFTTQGTYRQSTILTKLKNNLRHIWVKRTPAQWKAMFPSDVDHNNEIVIRTIQEVDANNE